MQSAQERGRAGVLRLAGPLVISFWFRSLFQWVDTAYASRLEGVGDASIAAIGLAMPFDFLMIACWVGASNGLTARLSAAMGAGQGARIEELKAATVRIVLGLSVVFSLLAVGLWLFGAGLAPDELTARQFRTYASVLVGGSAFTAFWAILPDSVVKAHQDTRSTMWAGLISTGLNVALNTLFVFGFGWGIFGIAFATVLGRLGGLAFALRVAARHERARRERGLDLDPSCFGRPVRAILLLALPAGASFLLLAGEGLAINAMLAARPNGQELLAAWSVFDRAVRFLSMPIIATGVALLPLCAGLWGARQLERIRHELRTALVAGAVFALAFVLPACWLLGPWLASALLEAGSARADAELALRFTPLAVLAMGSLFQMRSAFEGMQRARPGLLASLARSLFLVVPLVALGLRAAPALGFAPVAGACAGYVAGGALAAGGLALWIRASLASALRRGDPRA
jgi:Na+-driven multidrug efflux pump